MKVCDDGIRADDLILLGNQDVARFHRCSFVGINSKTRSKYGFIIDFAGIGAESSYGIYMSSGPQELAVE